MSTGYFKKVIYKMCLEIILKDVSLNNLQWLICHETKTNQSILSAN